MNVNNYTLIPTDLLMRMLQNDGAHIGKSESAVYHGGQWLEAREEIINLIDAPGPLHQAIDLIKGSLAYQDDKFDPEFWQAAHEWLDAPCTGADKRAQLLDNWIADATKGQVHVFEFERRKIYSKDSREAPFIGMQYRLDGELQVSVYVFDDEVRVYNLGKTEQSAALTELFKKTTPAFMGEVI